MASSFRGLVQEYLAGHASNVRIGKEISGSEASKKQHGSYIDLQIHSALGRIQRLSVKRGKVGSKKWGSIQKIIREMDGEERGI
ncbi:hypothetical protein GX48_06987 [Paracoccidioides brasiliensis]|nr:hypothetical protein GX48_06987 [Paracoccidioides brasiliensis]